MATDGHENEEETDNRPNKVVRYQIDHQTPNLNE